jgi:hypothetical protein
MVCAMSPVVGSLACRYDAVKPHLTERQRRVWLGAEARELGSSGVRIVAGAVQVSPDTVGRGRGRGRGRDELDDPQPLQVGRSLAPGGGRKRADDLDPALSDALDKLVGRLCMLARPWSASSQRTTRWRTQTGARVKPVEVPIPWIPRRPS